MTTVKELIKELEKMPENQYVLLNNNTDNNIISVFFTDINVERKRIKLPGRDERQECILLNQGAIF